MALVKEKQKAPGGPHRELFLLGPDYLISNSY